MLKLNLPTYDYQIKKQEGELYIYDFLRKKYLHLTPEEWVRQHFLHFLTDHKKVPKALIKQEARLSYNQLNKWADILVYSGNGTPLLMIECKASTEKLNEDVFFQLITYNSSLNVPYLGVTNGLTHYYAIRKGEKYENLNELPSFPEMKEFK